MTTTTDLKPGDVVRQPVHGYGIVYVDGTGETLVMHCSAKGRISIADLTGWERAEIVKPGHVQVRVDDLDLGTTAGRVSATDRLYVAFKTPQPDEPTVTRNLGGRVGLFRHPDIPGDMQHCDLNGDEWRRAGCLVDMTYHFVLDYGDSFETICPDGTVTPQPTDEPAQPDEPTGLGAVVEVGGKRFVRTDEDGHPWIDNVAYWHTWDEITSRGLVVVLSEGLAS